MFASQEVTSCRTEGSGIRRAREEERASVHNAALLSQLLFQLGSNYSSSCKNLLKVYKHAHEGHKTDLNPRAAVS